MLSYSFSLYIYSSISPLVTSDLLERHLFQEQILTASNIHRYEIKNKEGKLLVHNLTEADSGWYYCEAVYPISTTMGRVELRVR